MFGHVLRIGLEDPKQPGCFDDDVIFGRLSSLLPVASGSGLSTLELIVRSVAGAERDPDRMPYTSSPLDGLPWRS
jgi:hypothetical protein